MFEECCCIKSFIVFVLEMLKECWIKLDYYPLSSSEIEIGYGILPLLSNTEFLSSLEFPKTETKLIDIWQM